MFKKVLTGLAFAAVLLAADASFAQSPPTVKLCTLTATGTCPPVSSGNPLPISGSFSATLSPFTPAASGSRGTPISVTTGGASGTIPTNTGSVIVTNTGANPMYCNASGTNPATTSDQLITASGGWFNFGIANGVTTLYCISTGGSTTATMVGGSGLGAGTGGGGASGGGGAVFGPTAVGSAAANPPVLIGGTANATATGNIQVAKVDTNGTQFIDCSSSTNTLCGLVNSPPPLLVNGTNTAWTGLTPGTAQTGTIVAANMDITSVGGVAIGAMSNYGTSPGAVKVFGVNAALGNNPVGTASFSPAQVSVGTGATLIAAARTGAVGTGRVSITVTNTSTTPVYLGGSGVTTSTGQLLPGILGASVTINTTAAVYGIVGTGTETVTEFETF